MLGKTNGIKRRGHQRMRWLDMSMNLGKLWEMVRDKEVRHASLGPRGQIDMTVQLNSNDSAYKLNSNRRDSTEPRPRGCSVLGEPPQALPSF